MLVAAREKMGLYGCALVERDLREVREERRSMEGW